MRGFISKATRLLAAAFLVLSLLSTASAVFADENTAADSYTETASDSPVANTVENINTDNGTAENSTELSFREKYGKPLSIISITILLLLVLMQLVIERIESHRQNRSISAEAARLSDSLKVAETAGDIMAEYIGRQSDNFESEYIANDEVFELISTIDKLLKPYKTVFKNAGILFTVSRRNLKNNRLSGDKSALTGALSCLLCGIFYASKGQNDKLNTELLITEKEVDKTQTIVTFVLQQNFGSSNSLWIRAAKNLPGIADSNIKIRSHKSGKNRVTGVSMPLYIVPEDSQSAFKLKNEKVFDFSGRTVLIAENNELNLAILSELLKDVGFDTICVRNGQQAVYAFNKPRTDNIDIIILDTDMPIMNGFDAANTIKKCKHANYATVPIIGIISESHSKRPSELDKIKKSCLTDTVSRALNTDELYYTIEKCLEM